MEITNPLRRAFSENSIHRYDSGVQEPYYVDANGKVEVIDEVRFRNLPPFSSMSDQPLQILVANMEQDLRATKALEKSMLHSTLNINEPSAPNQLLDLPSRWLDVPKMLRYSGEGTDSFLRKQIIYNRYSQKVGHIPTMYYMFNPVNETLPKPDVEDIMYLKRDLMTMKARQCTTVIIPLSIWAKGKHVGHAEILLLEQYLSDQVKVSRYDPNGEWVQYWSTGSSNVLDAYLSDCFNQTLGVGAWAWNHEEGMAPSCPRVFVYAGAQSRADRVQGEGGFCQTWILLFVHLRLRNAHLSTQDIKAYLRNQTSAQLAHLIQNFTNEVNDSELENMPFPERKILKWKEETLLAHPRLDDLSIADREFILSLESTPKLKRAFNLAVDVEKRHSIERLCAHVLKDKGVLIPFSMVYQVDDLLPLAISRSMDVRTAVIVVLMGREHHKTDADLRVMFNNLADFITEGGKHLRYFGLATMRLLPATLYRIAEGGLSKTHLLQLIRFATVKEFIYKYEQHGVFSSRSLDKLEISLLDDEEMIDFRDPRLKRFLDRAAPVNFQKDI